MTSKGSYISLTDLTDIRIHTNHLMASRDLEVQVTAFYEETEYGTTRLISYKTLNTYNDFISMQAREKVIRDAANQCLEAICLKIQQEEGSFKMAIRDALKAQGIPYNAPKFIEA